MLRSGNHGGIGGAETHRMVVLVDGFPAPGSGSGGGIGGVGGGIGGQNGE